MCMLVRYLIVSLWLAMKVFCIVFTMISIASLLVVLAGNGKQPQAKKVTRSTIEWRV